MSYFGAPCLECGAHVGYWCRGDSKLPVCSIRPRLWKALGKPNRQREKVPELFVKMLEATLEENA